MSTDHHDEQDEATAPSGDATTRERLLVAARDEFARFGFDGASTRRIAVTARSHQPQINYFFGSKTDLWHAVVDHLAGEMQASMADVAISQAPGDVLADVVRTFVRFAHRRPELHRILLHEFIAASDRLDRVVDSFTGPAFVDFHHTWAAAVASGEAADVDRTVVYHLFVGAASLLPVARAEARRQLGADAVGDELIDAHAESLVRLLVPHPTSQTSTRP